MGGVGCGLRDGPCLSMGGTSCGGRWSPIRRKCVTTDMIVPNGAGLADRVWQGYSWAVSGLGYRSGAASLEAERAGRLTVGRCDHLTGVRPIRLLRRRGRKRSW